MPASYRAINYSLRPAKAVERKMMGEAFRRLHSFQRVEDYRYVGFGSIYFSDFQAVHRVLGINDMVSIEKHTEAAECFEFNRPFRSIDLKFGESNVVLPSLPWDKPSILWLDYDGKLDQKGLSDIDTFCARCRSGSFLVTSVNAQADPEPSEDERLAFTAQTGEAFNASTYRLRKLVEMVGSDKIPPGTDGAGLRGNDFGKVCRKIIDNQIASKLSARNGLLHPQDRIVYRQVFYFRYRDNAQMLTVGGVLCTEADLMKFDACAFEKLPFVRPGDEPYEIRVPCLTTKEIRHLNAQLPKVASEALVAPGVPQADLSTYAEVYRYFPSFSEVLFA